LTVSEKLQIETEPFLYDLVNVGREVLAQLTTPMALNFSDATSAQRLNSAVLIPAGTLYIQLLLDLDHLLSTNVAFPLRPWLELSRRLASEDEAGGLKCDCFSPILNYSSHNKGDDGCCKRFYEWNARCQVTTWNPTPPNASKILGGPIDYAAKHWSGLIRDYYAKRAAILLNQALQDQKRGRPLNSTEVQRMFAKHAFEWTTRKEKSHFYELEGSSSLERARKISGER
jgi:alpha-N-acetylglucosaminidase